MKKAVVIILAIAICISMIGCKKKKTDTTAQGATDTTSSVSSEDNSEVIKDVDGNVVDKDNLTTDENGNTVDKTTGKVVELPKKDTNSSSNTTAPSNNGGTTSKPTTPSTPNKPSTPSTPDKPTSTPTPKPEPVKTLHLPTQAQLTYMENYMAQLVNNYRVSKGLKAYITDRPWLTQAADIRVKETQTKYGHTRPNGNGFTTVLFDVGALKKDKYDNDIWQLTNESDMVGGSAENLTEDFKGGGLAGFDCLSNWTEDELKIVVEEKFNDFKNSAGHNKNMLNAKIPRMGVGFHAFVTTFCERTVVKINCIQLFC